MSTDLAPMADNAINVLDTTNDALVRLGEWVQAARHAHQLVAGIVDTAFIPDAYKPKVSDNAPDKVKEQARAVAIGNATAAVLQGITLGLDPMTALQQIYIVHGRPGMYARIKVALVQSRGHAIWVEDISDSRCTVAGRRKDSDKIERVTVTMDQARNAGWTAKNANYKANPQDMLYARAAGRVCDRIAADAVMGIASVEEIQDEIKATAEVNGTHRTVKPRHKAQAIESAPVEEPPLVAEQSAPQAAPTAVEEELPLDDPWDELEVAVPGGAP